MKNILIDLLASYLENHAVDDLDVDPATADELDVHGISVAALDDESFRLDIAGNRYVITVREA